MDIILHPDRVVERTEDVEPVIERNKKLRSEPQKSDWGRHVASIPCIFLVKLMDEYYADTGRRLRFLSPEMDELVEKKFLTDSDWANLRTDTAMMKRYHTVQLWR